MTLFKSNRYDCVLGYTVNRIAQELPRLYSALSCLHSLGRTTSKKIVMQAPCQTLIRRLGIVFSLLVMFAVSFCGCRSSDLSNDDIHLLVAASAQDATQRAVGQFLSGLPQEGRPRIVIASGASNSLAQQILVGAPSDIFISANSVWTDAVANGAVVSPLVTNQLVLAAPKSNSQNVQSIEDLTSSDVKTIAVAGEGVPVGAYAKQVIQRLSESHRKSIEPKLVFAKDSSALVAWLEREEVDAGFVYASDFQRSTNLKLVQRINEASHDPIVYSAVVLNRPDSTNREVSTQLLEWLKSDNGQAVFREAGFESASSQ